MIITKIRLQEEHPMVTPSGPWTLPVCDLNLDSSAGDNGYLIKASDGLGPPNLTSVVEGFDNFGVPILGSVSSKRDITLKIALKPGVGQSFSELRDDLYKFLSRSIIVSLMDDAMVLAQTTGYIREFDSVQFSNQPEIQLVIECVDGEFVAPEAIDIPFVDLYTLHPVINYEDGTAPTGLDLSFRYTAIPSRPSFSITNHAQVWHAGQGNIQTKFQVTYTLITNDVVTISTQTKNKRITLLRSGVTYDLAGYINSGAVWPKLYAGLNTFDWTFDDAWMDWLSASYIPRYWGV